MKISIRNPAPLGRNLTKWGDYHFAQSLQNALERRGVEVVQRYWPEWDADDRDADAILVLRGKRVYVPKPDQVALLWIMSHPATVTLSELERYSRVFFASETHRDLVAATHVPSEVMRQCTDLDRFGVFNGLGLSAEQRRGIVFVANSRGMRRHMVCWAIDCQTPLEVYGRHWKEVEPRVRIIREYVENDALPGLYAGARLSLNDHWGDMTYFGIINNRIFDCLACGVPILSDDFPELREVCGDALLYSGSAAEFSRAMQFYMLRYPDLIESTRALWSRIGHMYTFDARADQIIAAVTSSRPVGRPGAVVGRGAEPDAGPIQDVVGRLRARGRSGEIKVMHVNPTDDWMQRIQCVDDIGYLSAGIGEGGWHLRIDRDYDLLPPGSLDLLVIDMGGAAGHVALSAVLPAVMGKVRSGGLILCTQQSRDLDSILTADGLGVQVSDAGFPLYGKS